MIESVEGTTLYPSWGRAEITARAVRFHGIMHK